MKPQHFREAVPDACCLCRYLTGLPNGEYMCMMHKFQFAGVVERVAFVCDDFERDEE